MSFPFCLLPAFLRPPFWHLPSAISRNFVCNILFRFFLLPSSLSSFILSSCLIPRPFLFTNVSVYICYVCLSILSMTVLFYLFSRSLLVCPPACQLAFAPAVCLPVRLSVCLSVGLPVCSPLRLSTCLPVCLSASLGHGKYNSQFAPIKEAKFI